MVTAWLSQGFAFRCTLALPEDPDASSGCMQVSVED